MGEGENGEERQKVITSFKPHLPQNTTIKGVSSPYLLPLVQDGGVGGVEAEDDLQHLGQVALDQVAQLVDHHGDDVEEAVLPAQGQHGRHVRLAHGALHRLHARAWTGGAGGLLTHRLVNEQIHPSSIAVNQNQDMKERVGGRGNQTQNLQSRSNGPWLHLSLQYGLCSRFVRQHLELLV